MCFLCSPWSRAMFLSPAQWLGVVRVNISVIKILTDRPGLPGSKVQISPHSWYEAVNCLREGETLSGGGWWWVKWEVSVCPWECFPLWGVVCPAVLTVRYFISHIRLTVTSRNLLSTISLLYIVRVKVREVDQMTQVEQVYPDDSSRSQGPALR